MKSGCEGIGLGLMLVNRADRVNFSFRLPCWINVKSIAHVNQHVPVALGSEVEVQTETEVFSRRRLKSTMHFTRIVLRSFHSSQMRPVNYPTTSIPKLAPID